MKRSLDRGVVTAVLSAALATGFAACSSDYAEVPQLPADTDAGLTQTDDPGSGREIVASVQAAERFQKLSERFVKPPVKADPRAGLKDDIGPRPVIDNGMVGVFSRDGARVKTILRSEHAKSKVATVTLPTTATGVVELVDDASGVAIEFAAKAGSSGAEIQVSDGLALYPAGGPGGADVIHRVTDSGTEDFIVFEQRPERERVEYEVDVSGVAGLRLVENILEFLSGDGAPRLRISSPYLVDADGVRHHAKLEISGCAVDRSIAPTWDRPVTPPGSSHCDVSVSWDGSKVLYPAVLDPAWTATANTLAAVRWRQGTVRLQNGKVLVFGGMDAFASVSTSELYDPVTNTWGAAASMGTVRAYPGATRVGTLALAVGGSDDGGSSWLSTCEFYEQTSNVWKPTGSLPELVTCPGCLPPVTQAFEPQYPLVVTTTTDRAVIFAPNFGQTLLVPMVWEQGVDPGTATWAVKTATTLRETPLPIPLAGPILGGQVMVAGGYYGGALNTVQTFDPAGAGTWTSKANMLANRYGLYLKGTRLNDQRVLVFSGYSGSNNQSTAEVYDPVSNSWTGAGTTDSFAPWLYYNGPVVALHGNGKPVFTYSQQTYVFDPLAMSWSNFNTYDGTQYITSRGGEGGLVALLNGKLLIVPSGPGNAESNRSHLFDFAQNGSPCSSNPECGSGNCVDASYEGASDGVCCNTPCTATCNSCKASRKGSGSDGTCGTIGIGLYSYGDCVESDVSTCGTNGYCDGAGGCQKYSNTTVCEWESGCYDETTEYADDFCNGTGSCVESAPAPCQTGYKCHPDFQQCLTWCNNDDYCTSSYWCDFNDSQCKPKRDKGEACTKSSQCLSNFCVDQVCCESACNTTCLACSNALTQQPDGECEPIPQDTDPQNECSPQAVSTCGRTGACDGDPDNDGSAACQLYSAGTVCVAQTCGTGLQNNVRTCDGAGTCSAATTTNCSAGYLCDSTLNPPACRVDCTDDKNCASDYHCSAGSCVPDLALGATCDRAQQCQGNANCVDNVCCDSTCDGECYACTAAKKGTGADGYCGTVKTDTDPDNECAQNAQYPNSCAADGLCAVGACRTYAKSGVECDPDTCEESTLVEYSCNGAGTCKPKSTPCYPFMCDVANAVCRVACTDDSHCVAGSFCNNGTCAGQLGLGEPCFSNGACESKHCANIGEGVLQDDTSGGEGEGGAGGADSGSDPENLPGVCCDEACLGTCTACKASLKLKGDDGTCEDVQDGTDLKEDCPNEGGCGLDGACSGGKCRKTAFGTACGVTNCIGNAVQGNICDGDGVCVLAPGSTDCSPYVCRDVNGAEQCTNPCQDDNDCESGFFCENETCLKKAGLGKECETGVICESGYCIDGVCCDTSCNGQCEACDVPGNQGVCTPVEGEPHGSRAKCDQAGEECGGSCDGVNASACKYPPADTACGEPSCEDGLAISATCNGQGACVVNPEEECAPYGCGDNQKCRSRCEVDEDCSQGYACDETTQRCLPSAQAAECSPDRLKSIGQNGETSCRPFLCDQATGACAVLCATTNDCAPDFVCDSATKACLPKVPPSDDEVSACSVRRPGSQAGGWSGFGLFAAGTLFAGLRGLRRRRATRRQAERVLSV